MSNDGKCPIWGTPAQIHAHTETKVLTVDSPRTGGRYCMVSDIVDHAGFCFQEINAKKLLTSWLVGQRIYGIKCPTIVSKFADLNELPEHLPVHERADRLLKYLETKSSVIGKEIHFFLDNSSAKEVFLEMLAWSESASPEELDFLLNYLEKSGWVNITVSSGGLKSAVLTIHGYARLAELATKQINSSQGFVAMWFDDSMTEAYDKGIVPGIEDAGYKPLRIDKKEHANKIDDEIIAEIRRSRFVVADFTYGDTGHRGGVYYEAGFAHGLNIPVFFTCRKDLIDLIHFDTRQYNHIKWTDYTDLRKQLADRISAVIGDGPDKPPKEG